MTEQEFHQFPQIPELVKVIVLKQLDLETLLSFALTAKNSAKLVRECRLTPCLVEIRMEEHYRCARSKRKEKKCRIDVSFESGTFREGYNNFTWNFVENSSEFIKYVQHDENLYEPTYVYDKYVLDDRAVLNNLYQIENYLGCEVTAQNFDKVYSRIEDFLIKELFLPAKKVEVTAMENIAAELGDVFSSRNKLRVDKLTLEKEWKKSETFNRIHEGFQVDKLVIGRSFSVDYKKVNWREISAPARAVLFSSGHLSESFGISAPLPFHFQRAKIERCELRTFFVVVNAWLQGFKCMDQLSFLTAELITRVGNWFRPKLQECLRPSWTVESVQNKFISQTDSANKVVRVFHIQNGFELINAEDGARAFCWHVVEGGRDDWEREYLSKAHLLVWSSKYSEVSEEKGRQIIEERKQAMVRPIGEDEIKFRQKDNPRYRKTRKLDALVKSIQEHQVEIKEVQKTIETFDTVLQNAPKIEEEEHQEEELNSVDEQEFGDIEIIQKCLEHHPESSDLAKLASSFEFTLLIENEGVVDRQRHFEIQIKNTANNKDMAIKFQYIAQHDKFEVFLNETQLGKNALHGIQLRRASNNQYCDRLREKACRAIWLRLQTLFPTAEFSLTLRTNDRMRMPVLLSAQLKCTHVKLVGGWNADELEKTMKCLEITKKMEFSGDFKVGKMPSEMPFVDEIFINGNRRNRLFPSWTPKCREIKVESANDPMNRFLREVILDWKTGNLCSTFESMLVQARDLKNKIPHQLFLEEFDGKPWDPSQRSAVFWKLSDSQEMISHDLREGLDFQRSSDGSLATLLISNDDLYNLKFIAWKKGEEFKAPRAKDVEKSKTLEMEKLEQLQKKLADMKKEAKVLRWQKHEEDRMYRDRYRKSRVVQPDILDD